MESPIVNRVVESGLLTIDLGMFLPKESPVGFDLAEYLYMGLILKEKEFRDAMSGLDWDRYKDRLVAVHCSADAIVPSWAYMLVASRLADVAKEAFLGTVEEMEKLQVWRAIDALDTTQFRGQRVVVKGCGDRETGPEAFLQITSKLVPVVKSLMYGEPCSTVPVFKRTAIQPSEPQSSANQEA